MPEQDLCPPIHGEVVDSSTRDERAAAALVTAGAFVSSADRHVAPVEHEEVVRYIIHRQLAPTLAQARLARMFDERRRRLEEPDFANVVIDMLRPIAGSSLASDVIEISRRVAAADGNMHPYEEQAITLLRLITSSLPMSKPAKPARRASSPADFVFGERK